MDLSNINVNNKKIYQIVFFLFIISIFIYGLIVRYHALINSHNIFYDEAALVLNIKERTYIQLFLPIEYVPACPPLFLIAGKFLYEHFGLNLIALRCIPYIFSIVSLLLFLILSCKIFKNKIAICIVNFMFAFSPWILTYQMFFKHYINDVFSSVAILFIAYTIKDKQLLKLQTVLFAFLTILLALTSYTSILITASTILTLTFYKYDKQNRIKTLKNILIFLIIFLIFLSPYIYINILPSINRNFDIYWTSFTGSFMPNSVENIKEILNLLSGSMLNPFYCIPLIILSFFTLILSKEKFTLSILFLPLVLAIILGYLHIYPFIHERTILYIIPLFIIIIIKPLDICFNEKISNLVSHSTASSTEPVLCSLFKVTTPKFRSHSSGSLEKFALNGSLPCSPCSSQTNLAHPPQIFRLSRNLFGNTIKQILISVCTYIFFFFSLNITEIKRVIYDLNSCSFTKIANYTYEIKYKTERKSNVQAALKMLKKYGIQKNEYIIVKAADNLVYNLYDDKEEIVNLDNIIPLWAKNEENIIKFNKIPVNSIIYMYISEKYDDMNIFKWVLEYCNIEKQIYNLEYKMIKAKKIKNIETK